jgi:Alw26I/Eco31I/Esp3I family type II restriction endonuclease
MTSQRKIYEDFIKNHTNYDFIPKELKHQWVSVSKKGYNPRASYWYDLHKKLIQDGKLPKESTLVNVARFIHPTKKHVCKICNIECSIYYEYPTTNTIKWLNKTFPCFKFEKNNYLTIFDIYQQIPKEYDKNKLFTSYFGMNIEQLEHVCKNDEYSSKKLSPGVMGNPPDRLDGFHCYNSICNCRKTNDKGRSDENMKSYTRDRRAYETLSDGNILLANTIMGKLNTMKHNCFICGKNEQKMTADHIGPISLGFIHDSINFQACCASCNSSKNNRITFEDIQKLKILEEKDINIVSWWAIHTWNKYKNMDCSLLYKSMSENAKKFLSIIEWLKENKQHIIEEFITEIYMNHDKSYVIDNIDILSTGDIKFTHTETITHKKTKQTQKKRTIQILLKKDEKINRKIKICLSDAEIQNLSDIDIYTFKHKICKVLGDL